MKGQQFADFADYGTVEHYNRSEGRHCPWCGAAIDDSAACCRDCFNRNRQDRTKMALLQFYRGYLEGDLEKVCWERSH